MARTQVLKVPFKTPAVASKRHDPTRSKVRRIFDASRRRRGLNVSRAGQLDVQEDVAQQPRVDGAQNAPGDDADDADDEDDVAHLRNADLTTETAWELLQDSDGDVQGLLNLFELDGLAGLREKSKRRRAGKAKELYKCPHCGRGNHAMSDQRERDRHERECKALTEGR
jgi:hypothetical protein